MRRIFWAVVLVFAGGSAFAECTDYERAVFDLVAEAEDFRDSETFRALGWSATSPHRDWYERAQGLRVPENNAADLAFLIKHDFLLGDLVVMMDDFWRFGEPRGAAALTFDAIEAAQRC